MEGFARGLGFGVLGLGSRCLRFRRVGGLGWCISCTWELWRRSNCLSGTAVGFRTLGLRDF